jgi:predicted O-methyltransferase YrrM
MQVHVINPNGVNGEVSCKEARIIAITAARQSGKAGYALEIGTFRGSTTNNIAANFAGKVITVDLPKDEKAQLSADKCDIQYYGAEKFFMPEYEARIKQVFQDSATLNLQPGIDFAFIDGCHSEDYVYNDFTKIEPCMNNGGVVLFHDYGFWTGVTNCINQRLVPQFEKHLWMHHVGTALMQCIICRI